MYENKGKATEWISPLFDHSAIHALFTMIFLTMYSVSINKVDELDLIIALSGLFDFTTHFITDRWKATRQTDPSQSWFWKSLGIDQMIHHIVGILIVFYITQELL